MSKLNNLNVALELSIFQDSLGESFDKVVNDVKSMLGRIKAEEITAKQGEWKAGAKGRITSKEGYTVQLPLNNPASSLLLFGMKLRAIGESGEMSVSAEIPKVCRDWVHQHSLVVKAEAKESAKKTETVKS